jgi:hypothetical protein
MADASVFSGVPAAGSPGGKGTDTYRTDSPLGDATLGKFGLSATPTDQQNMFASLFGGLGTNILQQGQGAQIAGTGASPFDLQSLFSSFGQNAQTNALSQQGQQYSQLGGNIAQAFQNFDPNAFAQQQYNLLNQVAGGTDQTAANSLANRLFSSGRLGANDTTAGGAFGQLAQSQAAAQGQRALDAFGMANTQQNQLGNLSQMFAGLGLNTQLGGLNMAAGNLSNINTAAQGLRADQSAQNNNIASLFNLGGAAQTGAQQAYAPLQQAIQNLFNTQGATLNAYQARKAGESSNTNPLMSAFSGLIGGAGQGAGMALGSKIG